MKIIFLVLFFLNPIAYAATSLRADHVEVKLISPQKTVGSDRSLKLAVHFKIDPEWHVYWKNAGDSGVAPKFEISGGQIEKIHWPYPQRIPVKDLTNYGYENEVAFLLDAKSDPKSEELKLDLEWLVCKVECLPGFGTLILPIENVESAEFKSEQDPEVLLYNQFLSKIPTTHDDWKVVLKNKDQDFWKFEIQSGSDHATFSGLEVFPENGEAFLTKTPTVQKQDNNFEVLVPISKNNAPKESETFVFVAQKQDGTVSAFSKTIETKTQSTGLAMAFILALIGGLILNLMPCVFPVLSLKIFGFLKEPDPSKIKRSAWAYSTGAVLAFALIGAVLAILRSLGESVGWGYQLQNPWLIYLLALLFFAMALNFFGFFEMGNNLMAAGSRLGKKGFLSGDFGTGVLAVVVASPCTAPFMGSALGATLLLPAYQSLLVFSALGVGMAAPMLLLAYWPKLISKLPRSGAWMVTLKQFMTFPLILTSLWLLWVFHQQRGAEAVFTALLSFVVLTMLIWMVQIAKSKSVRFVLTVLLVLNPIVSISGIQKLQTLEVTEKSSATWQPFDPVVVSEKRKDHIVFIDFTASWCISCQVNKKAVLETETISKLFQKHKVFLVRADWTNLNPVITKALEDFGRNSIPLYVVYNKSDKPVLFPEVITQDMLINYFENGVVP